jgi:hypothetical protein
MRNYGCPFPHGNKTFKHLVVVAKPVFCFVVFENSTRPLIQKQVCHRKKNKGNIFKERNSVRNLRVRFLDVRLCTHFAYALCRANVNHLSSFTVTICEISYFKHKTHLLFQCLASTFSPG